MLEGHVWDIDPGRTRPRLRILVSSLEGVGAPPRFIDVSTAASGAYAPGRAVRCRAILRPPEGPMAPHGYDAARRAYFEQVGASGFTLGPCRPILLAAPARAFDRLALRVGAMRRDLTEAIYAMAPSEGGAVTAAMVTGDRSLMSAEATIWYRDSGLGHILSVSGLHMSLVAGAVYGLLHLAFACLPWLALRAPIRKWAAAAAILATAGYLVVSGASVPAQRAFVMTCVAMGAILMDRPAISMRGLAVAAVLILAWQPESVEEIGLQESFAATAALVAAFEMAQRPQTEVRGDPGPLINGLTFAWRGLGGMIALSLVAGVATDPFALFHFQRRNVYGLAANLTASPIISLVVPFAAVVAAALAPFGLADAPVAVMAGALQVVTDIAQLFADRPEAVRMTPAAPPEFLILSVAAIAWACLWRSAVRWLAAAFALAAIGAYALAPPIVAAADGDLRAVVAREAGEWRAVTAPRGSDFARERIGQLAGLTPQRATALAAPTDCDANLCHIPTPRGGLILVALSSAGLERACKADAVVLAKLPAPKDWSARCKPRALLDANDRARHGSVAIREGAGGLRLSRAAPFGRGKPWSGALKRSGE
jgi:competence protein ComEC